jgi:hypothetical protein
MVASAAASAADEAAFWSDLARQALGERDFYVWAHRTQPAFLKAPWFTTWVHTASGGTASKADDWLDALDPAHVPAMPAAAAEAQTRHWVRPVARIDRAHQDTSTVARAAELDAWLKRRQSSLFRSA